MAGEAENTKKEEKKEPGKEAAPAKSKKKLILIAVIAVAVIGAGTAAALVLKGKPAPKAKEEAEAAAEPAAAKEEHASSGSEHGSHDSKGGAASPVVSLDPFIVNLQDNSGTRYLKLTINLELSSAANASELTAQMPKVRDSLIILLSSKSYTDIGSVEGKYQMRDEIVARVNQFLNKGKVKTAYFTEFVIQ